MKLVDILARELKAWPEGVSKLTQSFAGMVFYQDSAQQIVPLGRMEISDDLRDEYVTRAEWKAAVDALNSPKVVEWDEFGFPPAGVSCEFTTNDGHNWKGCKILYADELSILTGELEGKADRRLLRKCDADVKFRPARTAEQVAAEEREKAIKEMMMHGVDAGDSTIEYSCAALYDAGYRKEPKPCGS